MTKTLEHLNERDFLYLELHHRVLAEFVSTGGSDLIQADELGLVANTITLKAPDESCFAAILPCGHTRTHTQMCTQFYSTSSSQGPLSTAVWHYYLTIINHTQHRNSSVTLRTECRSILTLILITCCREVKELSRDIGGCGQTKTRQSSIARLWASVCRKLSRKIRV